MRDWGGFSLWIQDDEWPWTHLQLSACFIQPQTKWCHPVFEVMASVSCTIQVIPLNRPLLPSRSACWNWQPIVESQLKLFVGEPTKSLNYRWEGCQTRDHSLKLVFQHFQPSHGELNVNETSGQFPAVFMVTKNRYWLDGKSWHVCGNRNTCLTPNSPLKPAGWRVLTLLCVSFMSPEAGWCCVFRLSVNLSVPFLWMPYLRNALRRIFHRFEGVFCPRHPSTPYNS